MKGSFVTRLFLVQAALGQEKEVSSMNDVEVLALGNVVEGFLEREKTYTDPAMTFGYQHDF